MFRGNDLWNLVDRFNKGDYFTWSPIPLRHLGQLLVQEELGEANLSILRLDGLFANNQDYGHIRAFALGNFRHEYTGPGRIRFATDSDFQENIACFNRHIGQPAPITWCDWNGRVYLNNSGTGHHTAAIYRQCIEQQRDFVFKVIVRAERLALTTIEALRPYRLLVCEHDTAFRISDWSSCFDPEAHWHSAAIPYGESSRFEDKPDQLVCVPLISPLRPPVEAWLGRTTNSFFDLSSELSAYQRRTPDFVFEV